MVPPSIRQNLAGLRLRERLVTFVFGAACFLAITVVLLFIACFVDWLIDRNRDTPLFVRASMLFVQLGVAALGGVLFFIWPQLRRLPDALLALWVESKHPQFQHRLISAVQFNEPDADLVGMSKELVGVVTKEAEKQAAKVSFAQVADHSRLVWSAVILLPILLFILIPLALAPRVSFALLLRQALLDVDVPHSVSLVSASAEVWPAGDTIPIRIRVSGNWDEDMEGTLRVSPKGEKTAIYPLTFIEAAGDDAIFGADVHPAMSDITYAARLYDGRTKAPSTMKVVPRPVVRVETIKAWVQLPAYVGTKPSGGRYEEPQPRGEVTGIAGSSVRVRFEVDGANHKASLALYRPNLTGAKTEDDLPVREVPMNIVKGTKDGKDAEGNETQVEAYYAETVFDLAEGLNSYRLKVEDEHGFKNQLPPRLGLKRVDEPAPQVMLLRDTFGAGADFDLEGLPVMLGGMIRIPYRVDAPFGMSKAQILYRVLKKHESGNEPAEEEKWITLPLTEVGARKDSGAFDPKTGVFENMAYDQEVPFHAVPSMFPEFKLGRTVGGGRYFLKTKTLFTNTGQLKSGDQIEYCVEVYAAKRLPEETTPVGRSETRVATVLQEKDFLAWFDQVGREDERVRMLELKQKGIFERK
jgi:hypothetical protein